MPSSSNIRNFKAWILTIVANIFRDELRKKRIRKILLPLNQQSSKDETVQKINLTEGKPQKNDSDVVDIRLALNQAIKALHPKQRQVFVLKEIEGLKHTEISEILNIPVGTVKSLLYRAIKKLQQELLDFQQ